NQSPWGIGHPTHARRQSPFRKHSALSTEHSALSSPHPHPLVPPPHLQLVRKMRTPRVPRGPTRDDPAGTIRIREVHHLPVHRKRVQHEIVLPRDPVTGALQRVGVAAYPHRWRIQRLARE